MKKRIVFVISILVIISVCVFSVCCENRNKNMEKAICGKWYYDEYTLYEFRENGEGCMCIENIHYKFEYKVNGEKLKINFIKDEVRDCSYTVNIEKDILRLTGGKGTVGGKYELERIEK